MLDKIFKQSFQIARHLAAPYLQERERYLTACAERGDKRAILMCKAEELYWIASKLSVYGDLHLSLDQVQAAALDWDWRDRERACGRKLKVVGSRKRFVLRAQQWLRYLGCLVTKPIPFQRELEQYCHWAREERGLAEATIRHRFEMLKGFLRWYGQLHRPLAEVQIGDIDTYLARHGEGGWSRISVSQAAATLRVFFRFRASQGWSSPALSMGIYGPRLYSLETLPSGPTWTDVERLLTGLDTRCPRDIRDRAILMLFAIYGLRKGEVRQLRLEQVDWEHDLLHVSRGKRRGTQTFPLLPSIGNAILDYLQKVRRPHSPHREVFLTLFSPYGPMSGSALYHVVATRLEALGVQTAHRGPHCLRHACATRLVSEGFSLKEIGDQLGHRTTSATRVYAKVDLRGLREVAAFDLGALL